MAQDFLKFSDTALDTEVDPLTSIAVGPDGNVYASSQPGDIYRWKIDQSTGMPVGDRETVYSFSSETDLVLGIAFDPAASAENLLLWTSSSNVPFGARGFAGQIDRLKLPSVGLSEPVVKQNYINGLPVHFHQNNGIAFANDGRLLMTVGALGAAGDDSSRPETPLSAALLVADVNAPDFLEDGAGIDVDTSAGYDPFAASAKVQIYADGIRNAYDVLAHSNGGFYAGVNGNDSGGRLPNDPSTPFDESTVNPGRPDETFINIQAGKYYGHPNPSIGNYISFGGNPTAGTDGDWENPDYPVGTQPDPDWEESLNFNLEDNTPGPSLSPNGLAEYTAPTGLQEWILISYYSHGDRQIGAIELAADGSVANATMLTDLNGDNMDLGRPLDVAVDARSGRVYVASHNGSDGALFLLNPLVTPEFPPGDFDNDGDVDGADFLRWQRGESPHPLSSEDLAMWEAGFGMSFASIGSASSPVPEPSSGFLLLVAGLAIRRWSADRRD